MLLGKRCHCLLSLLELCRQGLDAIHQRLHHFSLVFELLFQGKLQRCRLLLLLVEAVFDLSYLMSTCLCDLFLKINLLLEGSVLGLQLLCTREMLNLLLHVQILCLDQEDQLTDGLDVGS